jgi:prepilin-type N-terminal cleavage/methylation domain-containing protein
MDMRRRKYLSLGFTLLELLVVVGIIAMLASLLLPATNRLRTKAERSSCFNNLKQINLAVRMYADDFKDRVVLPTGFYSSIEQWFRYKEIVKSYLGRSSAPSPSDKLFRCPADSFFYSGSGYHSSGLCDRPNSGYSSYIFNGGNLVGTNGYPGISDKSLVDIAKPSRTVLVCEAAAFTPFSWHEPKRHRSNYRFKDSENMLSFVDGHAQYVKIYWSGAGEAWQYDPPPTYDYQWSGN